MRVEEEGDSSYGLEVSNAVRCGRDASALGAAKIAGASSFSSLLARTPHSLSNRDMGPGDRVFWRPLRICNGLSRATVTLGFVNGHWRLRSRSSLEIAISVTGDRTS